MKISYQLATSYYYCCDLIYAVSLDIESILLSILGYNHLLLFLYSRQMAWLINFKKINREQNCTGALPWFKECDIRLIISIAQWDCRQKWKLVYNTVHLFSFAWFIQNFNSQTFKRTPLSCIPYSGVRPLQEYCDPPLQRVSPLIEGSNRKKNSFSVLAVAFLLLSLPLLCSRFSTSGTGHHDCWTTNWRKVSVLQESPHTAMSNSESLHRQHCCDSLCMST